MTPPTTRIRTKTSRSRKGCQTCRLRHVKCDEARPVCGQCYATKRSCDGAIGPSHRDSEQPAAPLLPKSGPEKTPLLLEPSGGLISHFTGDEALALAFFGQHTAHHLQGAFQVRLWRRWVLQVSEHELGVLHAMAAVGALHRVLSTKDEPKLQLGANQSAQRLALSQYSKAIARLRIRMELTSTQAELSQHDIIVVLIYCLLFVCFETMQGAQESALEHIHSGIRLLRSTLDDSRAASKFERSTSSNKLSSEMNDIYSIFITLDCDSALLNPSRLYPALNPELQHNGDNAQISQLNSLPSSLCFVSAAEAKSHLDVIWHGVLNLRGDLIAAAKQSMADSRYTPPSVAHQWCYTQVLSRSLDLGASYHRFLRRKLVLENALLAFDSALKMLVTAQFQNTFNPAVAIVQIQFVYVWVHLATCRSTRELDCDKFNEMFRNAVELAEKFVSHAKLTRSQSTFQAWSFTLDPSLIPNISLIAMKCREPDLRRRASAALRRMELQEGMWNSASLANLTERIAEIEEKQAKDASSQEVAYNETVDSSKDILEQARYSDVDIVGDPEAQTIKLICGRYAHESDGRIVVDEIDLTL